MTKHSETLGRDAVYMKKMRVSRLPAYMTIQMVRFQFKQRDAVNAKILKDIKYDTVNVRRLDRFIQKKIYEHLYSKMV